MVKKLSLLSTSFALMTAISAQWFSKGKCRELEAAPGVEKENLVGIWYEYGKTPYLSEGVGTTCIQYDRKKPDGDRQPFVLYWVNPRDGGKYKFEGSGTGTGPGKGKTIEGFNRTIVFSDPNSYLSAYACLQDGRYRAEIIWIFTRKQFPNPEEMEALSRQMSEKDLFPSYFRNTRQENCPEDWSDATLITSLTDILRNSVQ